METELVRLFEEFHLNKLFCSTVKIENIIIVTYHKNVVPYSIQYGTNTSVSSFYSKFVFNRVFSFVLL